MLTAVYPSIMSTRSRTGPRRNKTLSDLYDEATEIVTEHAQESLDRAATFNEEAARNMRRKQPVVVVESDEEEEEDPVQRKAWERIQEESVQQGSDWAVLWGIIKGLFIGFIIGFVTGVSLM